MPCNGPPTITPGKLVLIMAFWKLTFTCKMCDIFCTQSILLRPILVAKCVFGSSDTSSRPFQMDIYSAEQNKICHIPIPRCSFRDGCDFVVLCLVYELTTYLRYIQLILDREDSNMPDILSHMHHQIHNWKTKYNTNYYFWNPRDIVYIYKRLSMSFAVKCPFFTTVCQTRFFDLLLSSNWKKCYSYRHFEQKFTMNYITWHSIPTLTQLKWFFCHSIRLKHHTCQCCHHSIIQNRI